MIDTPGRYYLAEWLRDYASMTPEQRRQAWRQAWVAPRKAGRRAVEHDIREALELIKWLNDHPEALPTDPPDESSDPPRGNRNPC
jgi:hypothetical protein